MPNAHLHSGAVFFAFADFSKPATRTISSLLGDFGVEIPPPPPPVDIFDKSLPDGVFFRIPILPPPTDIFDTSLPDGVFFRIPIGVIDAPPPPPPPLLLPLTTFKSRLEDPPLTSGGRGVILLESTEFESPLLLLLVFDVLNVVDPDRFNELIRTPPPPPTLLEELFPPEDDSFPEEFDELVTEELPGVVGVTGREDGLPPRTAFCIALQ